MSLKTESAGVLIAAATFFELAVQELPAQFAVVGGGRSQHPTGMPAARHLLGDGGPDAGLPPGGGSGAVMEVEEPDEEKGDRHQEDEYESDVLHAVGLRGSRMRGKGGPTHSLSPRESLSAICQ